MADLIQAYLSGMQRSHANTNVDNNVGVNPDTAADTYRRATESGVPYYMAESDPDAFNREYARRQFDAANPTPTVQALAADPVKSQLIANDSNDINRLSYMERITLGVYEGWQDFRKSYYAALQRTAQEFQRDPTNDAFSSFTDEQLAQAGLDRNHLREYAQRADNVLFLYGIIVVLV